MTITSTVVIADAHAQIDGRRDVVERHTFHTGAMVEVRYRAEVGADTAAIAAARVPVLEQQAAAAEAEGLTNG